MASPRRTLGGMAGSVSATMRAKTWVARSSVPAVTTPTPMWVISGLRMFSRCPGLLIQRLTSSWALFFGGDSLAMFSRVEPIMLRLSNSTRSWGVRPVGLRDPQPLAPAVAPQFFWLWAPTNFESASLFFHTNDDAAGLPWNRRAVWAADGQPPREFEHALARVDWKSGTRHAASATIILGENSQTLEATFTPVLDFFMLGLGYGHPKWGHGLNHGELAV